MRGEERQESSCRRNVTSVTSAQARCSGRTVRLVTLWLIAEHNTDGLLLRNARIDSEVLLVGNKSLINH